MKKVYLISMDTYCVKAKVWDKEEMIVYHTQIEDIHNHKFTPMEIPKMSYPEIKFRPTSLKAFMSLILP